MHSVNVTYYACILGDAQTRNIYRRVNEVCWISTKTYPWKKYVIENNVL